MPESIPESMGDTLVRFSGCGPPRKTKNRLHIGAINTAHH